MMSDADALHDRMVKDRRPKCRRLRRVLERAGMDHEVRLPGIPYELDIVYGNRLGQLVQLALYEAAGQLDAQSWEELRWTEADWQEYLDVKTQLGPVDVTPPRPDDTPPGRGRSKWPLVFGAGVLGWLIGKGK